MLEVAGLQAFYGESQILHGIDLSIAKAERVAVVGRNGAGKSTLLKSIMNGGPRALGKLLWRGETLDGLAGFERTRRGLSFVPEDRRIFPHLTVIENLEIAQQAARDAAACLAPDELIRRFPMLEPLTARYGNQLSGGQQQLLAVARGLAPSPELLLLDEPTEGLAPIIVEKMAKSIVSVCDSRGIALLLSEQNLSFARKCSSRMHVIDAGRIVFSGDWVEFDSRPEVKSRHLAV